jgi:hypothetical protein
LAGTRREGGIVKNNLYFWLTVFGGVPELRPILIACGLSLHWDLQSLIPREPKWMPLGPTIIAAIPRDRWQIEPYDPEQLTFMWYPKLPWLPIPLRVFLPIEMEVLTHSGV